MATLEISERSDNSMKVLTIEFEYLLFAIAVIDEWTETIYYYNSGKGKKKMWRLAEMFIRNIWCQRMIKKQIICPAHTRKNETKRG